jgi:hypothetical protein
MPNVPGFWIRLVSGEEKVIDKGKIAGVAYVLFSTRNGVLDARAERVDVVGEANRTW